MRTIQATKGKSVIVDDQDFNELSRYRWHYNSDYAKRSMTINGKPSEIAIHRFILKVPAGHEVDHVNGNTLDNRRSNLRIVTHQQNSWNSRNRRGTLKGVDYVRRRKRWRARITKGGTPIALGLFRSKEEAAWAYNQAATEIFGDYACPNNIPQPSPTTLVCSNEKCGQPFIPWHNYRFCSNRCRKAKCQRDYLNRKRGRGRET